MERTVKVTGTGKMSLPPDLTTVEMTLRATDEEYEKALGKAAEMQKDLKSSLLEQGFAESDIKTLNFSVNAEYVNEYEEGVYKNKFAGYTCVHVMKLEFGFDTDLLSRVLGSISESVTDPNVNIRFGLKEDASREAGLLRMAAEDAAAKAKLIAEQTGVTLGRLCSVTLGAVDGSAYSPAYFGCDNRCMAKASAFGADVTPEDASVSASATFVWEIV